MLDRDGLVSAYIDMVEFSKRDDFGDRIDEVKRLRQVHDELKSQYLEAVYVQDVIKYVYDEHDVIW